VQPKAPSSNTSTNDSQNASSKELSYDEAKALARHPDPKVRCALAERSDLVPEILYFLAADPDPGVRRLLAANAATPHQADSLLANDEDPNIRVTLAKKIARLAPGLSAEEHERIRHVTYLTLDKLAKDQLPLVRHTISETLKNSPSVPKELIKELARDLDLIVSAPVLEFSPILSDADLLDIIQTNPIDGALRAISKRVDLSTTISHSIAQSDDVSALTALLENPSAQLREDTLSALIDKSKTNYPLQAPLVRRPNLSKTAALRLAEFVAENLMHNLIERTDLPPETLLTIKKNFKKRLRDFPPPSVSSISKELFEVEAVMSKARKLQQDSLLTEEKISETFTGADNGALGKAALTLLTGLPAETIIDIINSSSPKAIISLIWKAGLSMKTAMLVQSHLAHIKPENVIHDTGKSFPLTEGEMRTQLAIFIHKDR